MGVYIPNMKIPSKCGNCSLRRIDGYCPLARQTTRSDYEWCDYIKEVPTPHGKLIDAGVLQKMVIRHLGIKNEKFLLPAERTIYELIGKAPVVIEQEDE